MDEKGFSLTGHNPLALSEFKKTWKEDRETYILKTSSPGTFAAGGLRLGAMNRVASVVGEGAMAISFVHKFLAE